jgi:hypothetical protein
VLDSLGITVEEVRAKVAGIVGQCNGVTSAQIPFTSRAKKVLGLAVREAVSFGHNYVATEHILLGLVRENEGVAARILLDFDADAEKTRNEIIRALPGPSRTKIKHRWITSPVIPDETALKPLLARLEDAPRIAEAWLVGTEITPGDGMQPYERPGIALVLDPPLSGDREADRSTMSGLMSDLHDAWPIAGGHPDWLFVPETIMRARQELATRLYTHSR